MTSNIKIQSVIGWILFAFMALYHIQSCNQNQKDKAEFNQYLNDTATYYKNKLGQEVSIRKAVEMSINDLKKIDQERYEELKKQFGSLKKLVSDVKVGVVHDTVKKEIPVFYDSGRYLFAFEDSCLNLDVSVDTNTKIANTNYYIKPINLQITTLYTKEKFFSKPELSIAVTNLSNCGKPYQINPYITTQKQPRPWYYHWTIPLITGTLLGTYTTIKITR